MLKKYVSAIAVAITLMSHIRLAQAASSPKETTVAGDAGSQFLQLAFKNNLKAVSEGNAFIVLDGSKMNTSLKKHLLTDIEHCKDETDGWYAGDRKVFKMENGNKAIATTLIHYICKEADQIFNDSILLVYPGKGKQWILIKDTMANIDSIITFGYSNRTVPATDSLVIVGHSHAMGGGIDVSKVVRIPSPEDVEVIDAIDRI